MTSSPDTARAWVDIDLDALVANARAVVAACGSRLLPMLKANGYGLGAVPVARALESLDPWGFGIATPEEAAALRADGITRPLLLTSPLAPEWIAPSLELGLRPAIGDPTSLRSWLARGDHHPHRARSSKSGNKLFHGAGTPGAVCHDGIDVRTVQIEADAVVPVSHQAANHAPAHFS